MHAGVVALLFSDIEGSTRLLQQLGPAYAEVLLEHRRLLREQFTAHEGTEQGTEGDSFFVTFPTPDHCVAAALAGQQALAGREWPAGTSVKVRMGLHVGMIQKVADTLVGMAVHEGARISGAAHGGQVLASADVVRRCLRLPDAAGWTTLGEHQLKDLAAPIELHQLTHPALASQFPPPRSVGSARSNLPTQPTAFIGRAAEVEQVRQLLLGGPLLTITGTGGVGKSRMALRVGADVMANFGDGVWFVDLASVSEPAAVTSALASSLNARAADAGDLADIIGRQRLLLIIDNCEHLISAASEVISLLLQRCPGVAVLATSREPLGLPGEVVWRVPPLSAADAAELLTTRARAANSRFEVTADNEAAMTAVCQRLDAIPLALELAAARLTSLSLEQLEARLDQRFRLLAGGVRGVVERHRALQATVDWSYGLLSDDEQTMLRRTGVFTGSFPLSGAEAVAGDFDPIDAVVLIDGLVRKSLLVVDDQAAEPRYRLLETIRQYALDHLVRADEAASARDAHLRWIEQVVAGAARTLWLGGDETTWLGRLDAEEGNLRAGIEWALERGRTDTAAALVFGAVGWYVSRGRSPEGLRLAQQVRAAGLTGTAESLADVAEMSLASGCGRLTLDIAERAHASADRLAGTPYEWARVVGLAHAAAWLYAPGDVAGAARAIEVCERLVEEARAHGPGAFGWTLQTLFWTNLDAGRLDAARDAADRALAAATEARLSILESRMAFNRARVAAAEGEHQAAWDHAEHAVRVARTTGETFVVAAATQLMADVAASRGDTDLARDLLASIIDAVAESMTQTAADEVVAKIAALSR